MGKPNEGENQREPRFSQEQYDMLKRCSDKKDMTEWNEWRHENPEIKILLQGADLVGTHLSRAYLKGADLYGARLDKAILSYANLESAALLAASLKGARLFATNLRNAKLGQGEACEFTWGPLKGQTLLAFVKNAPWSADLRTSQMLHADLRGACLSGSELSDANLRWAVLDSETQVWKPKINAHTDFRGTALETVRIDPGTRQLLDYNARRTNWSEWYSEHHILRWPVRLFWWTSNYGLSTWRVLISFGALALVFAVIYWLWPGCVMVYGNVGDIHGFIHALYFSVVTMTTLGFGDIAANPRSTGGQLLLMLQVVLGYVLLGALVTRFAVLFTAGGPAGKFADEKGTVEKAREFMKKRLRKKKAS